MPLPAFLIEALAALKAPEDRVHDEPVFPGLSDDGLRWAMICGCRHGGIPTFTMHDLRHRYVSLLVMAGVPLPLVRSVVGHSRASVTLDVYSHALLDEPAESLAARRAVLERRPGDVS